MKIKELLHCHQKWMKGDYDNGQDRYCILGAVQHCYPDMNEQDVVVQKLLKEIQKVDDYGFVDKFNDAPETKFKDVKRILDKCNV